MEIRDASGSLRANIAADGTVTARGTTIGFINPDGSAGDAYVLAFGKSLLLVCYVTFPDLIHLEPLWKLALYSD